MSFDKTLAQEIARHYSNDQGEERGLVNSFVQVCHFLYDHPDRLSLRLKGNILSVQTDQAIHLLARRYFAGFRRSDFPILAGTVPDEMVSIVMMEAFGYTKEESERIKVDHQYAMVAENCVGTLLERYLDSVLRPHGWHWCCGNFVKAIDFVRQDHDGQWLALQIKNRDNSENSSSSAIRSGTNIQKWFRSYSRTGNTNWHNLPPLMQGFQVSEQGFISFVRSYLHVEKMKRV